MAKFETHRAQADLQRAETLAATTSPYTIEVRFLGGLSDTQQAAFATAADRWVKMIVGDLPDVLVDGEVIDDVLILAQGAPIDGVGGRTDILGQAGPTHVRPPAAGDTAFTTAKGKMTFDTANLEDMESRGTLPDVITHEMGHVIGVGSLWREAFANLVRDQETDNPTFVGSNAMREYQTLRGASSPRQVPVENKGGAGTRLVHWRESVFHNELMSGFIRAPGNPLSRMTVASLTDLGYQVDLDAAEPYQLPDLLALAEEGAFVPDAAPNAVGIVLPIIPEVLPDESLRGQPS